MSSDSLSAAIGDVRARITAAARRVGRDPADVTLLGASKTVDAAEILAAARAGLTAVGENRAQELIGKQDALAGEPDAATLRWDFIGTLQRNKIAKVVGRVTLIHSVDSFDLAATIAARAAGLGLVQDVLLEVNTSGEGTKHGVSPDDAIAVAERVDALAGVRLAGLMTMAAPGDASAGRAAFRRLAALANARTWAVGVAQLSMGMSADFEIAVEEGATIVRVGTAIFGARCDAGLGA